MKKLVGNAIVGQSGGPTAAINATLAGVIKGALASPYIKKIYGMRNGIEGMLEERFCDLSEIFAEQESLICLFILLRLLSARAERSCQIPTRKRIQILRFLKEFSRYSKNTI